MRLFTVIVHKRVHKITRALPRQERQRIFNAIASLNTDPFQGKELHREFEEMWTLRVGPYRILYTIQKEIATVNVVQAGHRQGAYK